MIGLCLGYFVLIENCFILIMVMMKLNFLFNGVFRIILRLYFLVVENLLLLMLFVVILSYFRFGGVDLDMNLSVVFGLLLLLDIGVLIVLKILLDILNRFIVIVLLVNLVLVWPWCRYPKVSQ